MTSIQAHGLHGGCWRTIVGVVAVLLLSVSIFCLLHCAHDGGMSPEECAKMMVVPSVAALLMIVSTMALAPGLSLGLPPLRVAALDHPPRPFLR